jgi:hypothetical protein
MSLVPSQASGDSETFAARQREGPEGPKLADTAGFVVIGKDDALTAAKGLSATKGGNKRGDNDTKEVKGAISRRSDDYMGSSGCLFRHASGMAGGRLG